MSDTLRKNRKPHYDIYSDSPDFSYPDYNGFLRKRGFLSTAVEETENSDRFYRHVLEELRKVGFEMKTIEKSDPDYPDCAERVEAFKREIGVPDENTHLIGHSVGVPEILNYINSLKEGEKIGGIVLVAGFTDPMGYTHGDLGHEERRDELVFGSFFETPLDFEKIKARAGKVTIIFSKGDPYIDPKYAYELHAKLGGELIEEPPGMGHMSVGVRELPSVVMAVKRQARITV